MIFDSVVPTDLCILMGNYGSDKGNENLTISPYNYTTLYYKLFSPRRYENLRIFELGLGTNNINIPQFNF